MCACERYTVIYLSSVKKVVSVFKSNLQMSLQPNFGCPLDHISVANSSDINPLTCNHFQHTYVDKHNDTKEVKIRGIVNTENLVQLKKGEYCINNEHHLLNDPW